MFGGYRMTAAAIPHTPALPPVPPVAIAPASIPTPASCTTRTATTRSSPLSSSLQTVEEQHHQSLASKLMASSSDVSQAIRQVVWVDREAEARGFSSAFGQPLAPLALTSFVPDISKDSPLAVHIGLQAYSPPDVALLTPLSLDAAKC